ncbi:MAG: STY4526/YPO1902 family pathogenicity island replication protein [Gammaproteobacteria bacterium]|nr:STY4526/YPO1902 family pathogenicity island replication protein [Gammaproteobacteria bacterium]
MSNDTKEAGLVSSVFMYATRCLAEADWTALRAMRFGPREIEALREMSMADLYRIEALRGHCLEIRLDRQAWWQMIEHLRNQRKSEETLHSLVAADAPQEMIRVRDPCARLQPPAPQPFGGPFGRPTGRAGRGERAPALAGLARAGG